ncbi:MAG: hypothetical protein KGI79_03340, partial [Patescibacteria group bacterium]|nr:hypothetical protein [Patescibacteria group bacterium]
MSFLSSYPVVAEALAFAIMCGLVNVSHTLLYSFKGLYGLYASDPPVDGGAMLGRDRILGDSTTVWGLFVSLAVGAALQAFFSPFGLVIGGACYVG